MARSTALPSPQAARLTERLYLHFQDVRVLSSTRPCICKHRPSPRWCPFLLVVFRMVLGMAAVRHPDRPDHYSAPLVIIVSISTSENQSAAQLCCICSNPIQDATDPTLACNDDGTPGALQLTATVAAGTPITAYWNQVWPHAYGPMVRTTTRDA